MRFTHKNIDYEIAELHEPLKNETFDIIAIFKINYYNWKGVELVEATKDKFDIEKLEFVDYFYGALFLEDEKELIEEVKVRLR